GLLKQARDELDKIDKRYREEVRDFEAGEWELAGADGKTTRQIRTLGQAEDALASAEDRLKQVTGAFDRFAKTTAQKNWGLRDAKRMFKERKAAGEDLGFNPDDLPEKVKTVKLTQGQVNQFAAHPRLDLFVDSNSPHPMQSFGCTICHNGQGSATDFELASH